MGEDYSRIEYMRNYNKSMGVLDVWLLLYTPDENKRPPSKRKKKVLFTISKL